MGITPVAAAIRNPAAPERVWEGLFLVDTGTIDCLVPRRHLESIGLAPVGQRIYSRADGSEVKMGAGVAKIEFMGDFTGGTVLFGNDDAEPLLGVTALESLGIEIDPLNRTLRRMPSVRMPGYLPHPRNKPGK